MCKSAGRRPVAAAVFTVFLAVVPARTAPFAGGTGQPGDPYQIATAEQLISIGSAPDLLDKHFVLVNDIDLDPNLPGGRVFPAAVIAFQSASPRYPGPKFTGVFDGDDYRVRNLTISSGNADDVGLFASVGVGGMIQDLHLEDIRIYGNSRYVGGLAGYSLGTIARCSVTGRVSGREYVGGVAGSSAGLTDCRATVAVSGGDHSKCLGGLAGEARGWGVIGETRPSFLISGCHASGIVSSGAESKFLGGLIGFGIIADVADSHATGSVFAGAGSACLGGLMGYNFGGKVVHCYAAGSVSGGPECVTLGGLIGGLFMKGEVQYCYATGAVVAGTDGGGVGGLAGFNEFGTIVDCYSLSSVSAGEQSRQIAGLAGSNRGVILRCYAAGPIHADASCTELGGLVAKKTGGEITACFWDVDAVRLSESAGGTGLSTARMRQLETFIGWDFADVWMICEGRDYPRLRWEGVACE